MPEKRTRTRSGLPDRNKKGAAPEESTSFDLCLIDVGGGMRGIYAAGVLDGLLEKGIEADLCIGVSAGSANLGSYLARQHSRTYAFYHDFAFRKAYASIDNLVHKKSFFDFDYIYSTLSNSDGEYPLDYETMKNAKGRLISVATSAITGKPIYFSERWIHQDDYSVFKASCSVPLLCHTNTAGNIPCCDGTVSDPIPVQKALDLGAKKIVILMPRVPEPIRNGLSTDAMLKSVAHSNYGRKWPRIVQALAARPQVHNRSLALARKLQEEGRLIIVSPQSLYNVQSLGGSKEDLDRLYMEGIEDADQIEAFLAA